MNQNTLKMALATGSLLAGAEATTQANIVYTPVSSNNSGENVYFSLPGRYASTGSFPGNQFKVYGGKGGNYNNAATISQVGTSSYILSNVVNSGDTVGSSGTFVTSLNLSGQNGTGSFFVGLSIPDPSVTQTDYGWAQISVSTPPSEGTSKGEYGTATVNGFAYDNSGAPILVGAGVPEPTNNFLVILLTGSLAVSAVRRQRRIKAGLAT